MIRDLADPCAALSRWSFDYLVRTCGERVVPVEYSVRGTTRPDPRINGGRHLRKPMRFRDALHAVRASPLRGVTHYVSALSLASFLPELEPDVRPPGFLSRRRHLGAYFFAGADGSGAVLHYDPTDNYIFIVEGEKDFLFFPPGQLGAFQVTPLWQPFCGISRLPPRRVDELAEARADAQRCTAREGDLVYVPRNYWHAVQNRGLCIAASMVFDWPTRSMLRWRQARLCVRIGLDRFLAEHPSLSASVDEALERAAWRRARASPGHS